MKIMIVILFALASTMAHAHSGHGEAGVLAHEFEHFMWMVSGVALLVSVVAFKYLRGK